MLYTANTVFTVRYQFHIIILKIILLITAIIIYFLEKEKSVKTTDFVYHNYFIQILTNILYKYLQLIRINKEL